MVLQAGVVIELGGVPTSAGDGELLRSKPKEYCGSDGAGAGVVTIDDSGSGRLGGIGRVAKSIEAGDSSRPTMLKLSPELEADGKGAASSPALIADCDEDGVNADEFGG